MLFFHILVLALVQGITEFLPISSSGHLILTHRLLDVAPGADTQAHVMDVAVHVGTLASVLLYFRKDVMAMFGGALKLLSGRKGEGDAVLALHVLIGSVPVLLAGFVLEMYQPVWMRSVEIIAWTTLVFGIVLWAVDAKRPQARALEDMTWRDALFIGAMQVLALVPGVSRAGITMTAARWGGFSRIEAARYSLLLAVIAISGAGTLAGLDIMRADNAALTSDAFLAATLSFVSALAAIALMMKWLARASFKIFGIYRIVLGLVLLVVIYNGGF